MMKRIILLMFALCASVHADLNFIDNVQFLGTEGGINFYELSDSIVYNFLIAEDFSGNGNDNFGTLPNTNILTQVVDDWYADLNGSTDYLTVPNIADPALSDMTLMCWINPSSISNPDGVMGWGLFGNNERCSISGDNSSWYGTFQPDTFIFSSMVGGRVTGSWMLLAMIIDRDGNLTFRRNLTNIDVVDISAQVAVSCDPAMSFDIGRYSDAGGGSPGFYQGGLMTGCRVYRRAITASEYTNVYNATESGAIDVISTTDLVQFLSMKPDKE